jgi:hypothetical protein
MSNDEDKKKEPTKPMIKDLRKKSSNSLYTDKVDEDDEVRGLEQNSVIPVPGLLIEQDNSGTNQANPSSWNNPNNGNEITGPSWTNYTRN